MDKTQVLEREQRRFADVRAQLGCARRMVAALLLSAIVSQRALAQEAPAQGGPAADAGSAAEAPAALPAPAPSAPSAPAPSAAAPAPQLAPEAVAAAWQELRSIGQREDLLWKQQADARPGLPATAVALGIPMFGVLLPIGALLVAEANSDTESGSIDRDTRRDGATLIGFGTLGFAALVAGTYMLVRLRRARMQRNDEIRSLEERRSLLESIVEADWRAAQGASGR